MSKYDDGGSIPERKPLAPRESVLQDAINAIMGDRNNQYGPPTQDFTRTAEAATALGFRFNGGPLDPHHVAIFMIVLKLSRLTWNPDKKDSWIDVAGYSGCGFETILGEE